MEFYIFNMYLKYQKEKSPSFFKRIKKSPSYLIIALILAIIFAVVAIVCMFVSKLLWLQLISSFLYISIAFISFLLQDRWEIKHSEREMKEFEKSSLSLYKWLSQLSITSREDIDLLIDRLETYVDDQKANKKAQNEKIDKWMQTLIIPLILAIITALIANQTDIEAVFIYIFLMLAIVAIVYGLIWLFRSIVGILQSQKRNKIEYFIGDLQGVLDVVFIFNKLDKQDNIIEKNTVTFKES